MNDGIQLVGYFANTPKGVFNAFLACKVWEEAMQKPLTSTARSGLPPLISCLRVKWSMFASPNQWTTTSSEKLCSKTRRAAKKHIIFN